MNILNIFRKKKEEKHSQLRLPFISQSLALIIVPFEELLTLPFGSVLRIINFVTLFLSLWYSSKIYLRQKKVLYPLFIFFGYAVLSILWCINRTYYFDRLFTYSLYILLITFLQSLNPNKREKDAMIISLYVGGLITSILLILNGNNVNANIGDRETLILLGRSIDPNILSFSCAVSLIINLNWVLFEKKTKMHIVILPLFVYSILHLGSRGAFLTVVIVITIMLMNVKFQSNRYLKKLLLILFSVLIAYWVYKNYILSSDYGSRLTIDNLLGTGNLGTANRSLIWDAAIEQFCRKPLIGYGNGASMYAIEMVYKFYGTHNSYLLVLLEFGIIGFMFWSLWIMQEFTLLKKNSKKIYIFLFISLLAFIFFVEGLSTKIFWCIQIILMTSLEK